MSGLHLDPAVEGYSAGLGGAGRGRKNRVHGRQDKSADQGRAHVVGCSGVFSHFRLRAAGAFRKCASNLRPFGAIAVAVSATAP